MRELAHNVDRQVYVVELKKLEPLPVPFGGEAFPCLLWDHLSGWPPEDRTKFAHALIRAGCRYAVCAGTHPHKWHLAFDLAFLEENGSEPHDWPAGTYVMTSEHTDEAPDEVASFFVLGTNFDTHYFKKYLVLHLGSSPNTRAIDDAIRTVAKPAAA